MKDNMPDFSVVKTYGVKGLLEWQLNLRAGQTVIPVNFTGGVITGYGVTPATFSTSDPVMQRLIEKSYWFRKGRIAVVSVRREKKGDGSCR